jgi:hypothetical protein
MNITAAIAVNMLDLKPLGFLMHTVRLLDHITEQVLSGDTGEFAKILH